MSVAIFKSNELQRKAVVSTTITSRACVFVVALKTDEKASSVDLCSTVRRKAFFRGSCKFVRFDAAFKKGSTFGSIGEGCANALWQMTRVSYVVSLSYKD